MDICKNSLSITRYLLTPNRKLATLQDQVDWPNFGFTPIDATADKHTLGLVQLNDYETPLTQTPAILGGYLFLRLRLDTRKISPAVLARRQRQALEKRRAELHAQSQTLTREEQKAIRAQVRQQLLAKAEPRPKTISLVVTPAELWAFTARPRELALVEDFAAKLLRAQLQRITLASLPNREVWSEEVTPHYLTRLALSELYRQQKAGNRQAKLRISRDVRLSKDREQMAIQTTNLAAWPEIGLSITKGKTIFQAGLELDLAGDRYTLQLHANWSATRVKVPPLNQAGDMESALVQKMNALRRMFSALDWISHGLLPGHSNTLAA